VEQRPRRGIAGTAQDLFRRRLERDDDGSFESIEARSSVEQSASAEGDHGGSASVENAAKVLAFEGPERGLTAFREERRDGSTRGALDLRVEIDVRPTALLGEKSSHGRLARRHEPAQEKRSLHCPAALPPTTPRGERLACCAHKYGK
jgi:hypothetical protein